MGLFSRKKVDKFVAPASGELIHLDKVSDPVFSQKLMGDGFAITPDQDEIFAPIGGVIGTVFPTKHALMITSDHGLEVMLHLGIDTVELNGKPFETFVKEGDTVKAGQKLATMDLAQVKAANKDTAIMTIVTNSDAVKDMPDFEEKAVKPGDEALDVTVK
ncbi:PTS system, glucose glucoside-specific enzyme IIA component [Companilactobacillus mindensis DSM 14500]|uniref:PTS system, glucose glucoside-specific enzyme IIA component n=1 Tax=Companilactobacillus mindensis DSM 14500 TaxID=1423770 RepID=A0A0R1QM75_9LACO|nr:PTS glucose transporter subunit IIA [Companilactobacillus mindensis]KRL45871.1 PTS system, glucose glucoside-specific enzyme IIA component [Companilactobacillus mindensis DSM 14500]GEO77733.1 PTS glucose transporter subunit IIABC [Companilactobacillus mindensis]